MVRETFIDNNNNNNNNNNSNNIKLQYKQNTSAISLYSSAACK